MELIDFKPIYLAGHNGLCFDSVADLLAYGFNTVNGFFRRTFNDTEGIDEQCHAARRSINDICCIVKTYFPEATIEQICYELWNISDIYTFLCPDINKFVFRRHLGNAGPSCSTDGQPLGNEDITGWSYTKFFQAIEKYKLLIKNKKDEHSQKNKEEKVTA